MVKTVMISKRNYSATDHFLMGASRALETLFGCPHPGREYPGISRDNTNMSENEKRQSARYMRVNHVGEICAQALYQSQALTARDPSIRENMQDAADEEIDHLAWCEQRIEELGGRKSILNPLWYTGSFTIGVIAGVAGDKWNLGFVAETENQVVKHLDSHLGKLPTSDLRSREVIQKMKEDESRHEQQAKQAGAAELPAPAKALMKCASAIMTRTAHWV